MSKKTASSHGSGMSIHGTTLPPSGKDGENQGGLQSWRSAGVLANILWSVGRSVGPSVSRPACQPVCISLLSCACVQERGRTTEKEGEGESVRERERLGEAEQRGAEQWGRRTLALEGRPRPWCASSEMAPSIPSVVFHPQRTTEVCLHKPSSHLSRANVKLVRKALVKAVGGGMWHV